LEDEKRDENKIDVFQSRCLRRIFKIRWQDRITNKEVLQMALMENLSEDDRRRRWKFIGHIMRKLRTKRRLQDCINLKPGRATKAKQTQDNIKKDGREREKTAGWKHWSVVHITAANRAGWRESVGALCATCHEEDS